MSKEREDFIAWYGSNPEQDEHGNYTGAFTQARWETWQAATAHYQPLLEAKDAEIAGLKNARIYTDNSKAAALLQVENTTLKALLEQASKTLNAAKRAINGREHTGFIDKTLAAINAATGKGE